MVYDYAQGLYGPAARQYAKLAEGNTPERKRWRIGSSRVRQAWPRVVLRLLNDAPGDMTRGERLRLRVAAALAGLQPADVRVEFIAPPSSAGELFRNTRTFVVTDAVRGRACGARCFLPRQKLEDGRRPPCLRSMRSPSSAVSSRLNPQSIPGMSCCRIPLSSAS